MMVDSVLAAIVATQLCVSLGRQYVTINSVTMDIFLVTSLTVTCHLLEIFQCIN